MHTFEGVATRIHHNGDFSGDVIITKKDKTGEIEIPFADIRSFVADYVRRERESQIANMTDGQILGIE